MIISVIRCDFIMDKSVGEREKQCDKVLKAKQHCEQAARNTKESYRSSLAVKKHKKDFSRKPPRKLHECKLCGSICKTPSTLKSHVRTHTGEKPFTCSYCEKTFSHLGNLKIHERRHTDERPFTCEDCGLSFLLSGLLRNHKKTHTEEKSFVCSICGKSFFEKYILTRHVKIHTGEKPFLCGQCGKAFQRQYYLKYHKRTVHKQTHKKCTTRVWFVKCVFKISVHHYNFYWRVSLHMLSMRKSF